MRKIISLLSAVAIICSSTALPSYAEENEAYADFVPAAKTENLIPDASMDDGYMYFGANHTKTQCSDFGYVDSELSGKCFKCKYTKTGDLTLTAPGTGFEGITINQSRTDMSGNLIGNFGFNAESGKTYVLSANLKNASEGDLLPFVGASMNSTAKPSTLVYTNEYGENGMQIGNYWTKFNVTITLPEDYISTRPNRTFTDRVMMGFPAGTGEGAGFLMDVSEKDSVYFAREQRYDITCDTDKNSLNPGEASTFEASVVNQVGAKGTLLQSFNWTVLDSNRNPIEDGFAVEKSGNTATLTVGDSVEEGTYYMYASSTDYTDMGKACAFSIEMPKPVSYEDYVPGEKSENLITDVTAGGGFTYLNNRNNAAISNGDSYTPGITEGGYCFKYYYEGKEPLALENGGWRGFEGFEVKHQDGVNFMPDANKTYVVSLYLKNASPEGIVPFFGCAMNETWEAENVVINNEYGEKGMPIPDEWTQFRATLTLPEVWHVSQNHADRIFMGFPMGTQPGAAFWIDASSKNAVYLAEEQAYDITNEIENDPEIIRQGDTVSLKANIVDQIGLSGGLKQEFDFFVIDENNIPVTSGFNITENENKATIQIGDNVTQGKYSVFAKSVEYPQMMKSVKIDVKKGLIKDLIVTDSDENAARAALVTSQSGTVAKIDEDFILKAEVVNQKGLTADLVQDFSWYVLGSDQCTASRLVTIEKQTPQTAKLNINNYADSGTYFAVCEPTEYSGIRKVFEFTVDKPNTLESIVKMANQSDATALAQTNYLTALGIDEELCKADLKNHAEIVANSAKNEKFTTENVLERMKKISAISLYNTNPNKVILYDEKGEFVYSQELELDKSFANTTIMKLWNQIIDVTGKLGTQKDLVGKSIKSEYEFYKLSAQSIMLNSISNPNVLGSAYVGSILTEENAKMAGLEISAYLSLSDKSAANALLARKTYTKQALENAIAGLKQQQSGGGNTGGSSSGGGGTNVATAVTDGVSLVTKPTENGSLFDDVGEEHWAYEEIYHLKKLGVLSGVDENRFEPDMNVTREQFVKMFMDSFKYEKSSQPISYKDVKPDAWYTDYICAAVSKGLIKGISNDEFGVGMPITRQDICVILMRALKGEEGMTASFTDADDIDEYAMSAVAYLSEYGVIKGFEDGTFLPHASCTRAQAAKIICTIMNLGGIAE